MEHRQKTYTLGSFNGKTHCVPSGICVCSVPVSQEHVVGHQKLRNQNGGWVDVI